MSSTLKLKQLIIFLISAWIQSCFVSVDSRLNALSKVFWKRLDMTKRSANLHKTRFKDGAAVEAIFVSLWPHASSHRHVTINQM